MYSNMRQRICVILVGCGSGFILGFTFMITQMAGCRPIFGDLTASLSIVTFLLSAVGAHVGVALLKQQTRIEQIEEELARLKTDSLPPQSQQP